MEKLYLSFDLGGTYTKYAFINVSGNIVKKDRVKTSKSRSELLKVIDEVVLGFSGEIKGIVFSCPGKVDNEGAIFFGGALTYLHEFPLKKIITEKYHVRCEIINDGKAAALAEMWLGNLKTIDSGVAIVLGTGVGGGIVLNGEIVQGVNFQAGELSLFLKKSWDGSMQLPTAENFIGYSCSAVMFIKEASKILGLSSEDGAIVFLEINKNKNVKLIKLFKQYCREISVLIMNIQALLDCQRIVLGGGISNQPVLISEVERQYYEMRKEVAILEERLKPIEIMACKYRSDANILGALFNLLNNY